MMTLTIHLPEDIESHLRFAASQLGIDPAEFAAGLIADGLRAEDDSEAIAAIRAAVAAYETDQADGDRGVFLEDVVADVRAALSDGGDHDIRATR